MVTRQLSERGGSLLRSRSDTSRFRAAAAQVLDPELPVLTIADLGVLRDVQVHPDGLVEAVITPTYSGCPAMEVIAGDVEEALRREGFDRVVVTTALSPAWTTDWISEEGRRALAEHGVAPPSRRAGAAAGAAAGGAAGAAAGPVAVAIAVRCPRCGSLRTRELSRFGSTACKSLHACEACLEPFDRFKDL
jgi:ring-1,2-phenylacetyl-CoA epoxidase subunit PaaD